MRILELNKFYDPHTGGIETVVKQHAEYFNSRKDCDVKVLTCVEKGKGILEKVNGVDVIRVSSLGVKFSCPLSLKYPHIFHKMSKDYDIVECHFPFPLADLAVVSSRFKGKVVIYWHSDIIRQKKLLSLYKPLLMKFLNRADLILCATQNHIESSEFLPMFRDKCKVVPYGINPKDYEKIKYKNFLGNKLNNKSAVKIFFTGRLVYYKGVDVLLEAFCRIKNENCELFIAGDGVLASELKAKAKKENISEKVHFLGYLSDDELKSAFYDCDIFVLPSVANSEAFGIVQLEAMVNSKPVINTTLPTGVPLVSLNNYSGISVMPGNPKELANAMKKLVKSPELRKKYGENAKLRVESEFTLEKSNRMLYNLYKELLCG